MILVTPTYNRFDECIHMIESAYAGTVTPSAVIIVDNSNGKFLAHLRQHKVRVSEHTDLRVYVAPTNYGCSRAWNYGIRSAYSIDPTQHVIVSNDDITFHKDTLELFERAIVENPNELIYVCGGIEAPNAFSLFATRLDKMENTIGMFDEFFLYPYAEDGDYARRMMLAGLKLYRIPNAKADHIGSATIQAYGEDEMLHHHIRFQRNTMYFEMKWGCDHNNWMSQEGFKAPFDNDPQLEEIVKATVRNVYGE